MKLNPGERSIFAYFPSRTRAEAAAVELNENDIGPVQIDRISRYGVDHNRQLNNPIAGQAETGTGLTLFSKDVDAFVNNDARVLMGADPSNSGYGRVEDQGGGKAFMVGIVTTNEKVDKAVQIIKKHHGYV